MWQMSSAGTIPVSQLLQLKDDEFDTTIKDMGQRNLMEAITGLQKEMAKEQENFNSMSEELKGFRDRNSRQYKQISKDLMASQTRLTSLMNKSMKCFAQQNLQQGKDGITVKRRNSAKGTNPNSPTKIVQRSQSMYIPQEPNLTLKTVAPPEPSTIRTGSNQNINRISVVNSNLKNTHNPSSKSTSNIIRVTNPNKPFKISHNFSPVSSPSNPLSQNLNNSSVKKSILFNSKPDEMKTSISIASKNAVITSSPANSLSEQSYTQNNSNNDEAENLSSVRRLAQSFGNSKQPNAPPRPNRSTILNRNFSISNQNLSHPQKVNGVQSSLQNGDISSQQRKVVQQSVNISGKNNMVQSRPVSVLNSRDTTPQRQNVELIPKAHSVQNLTSDSNDNVKTTLTVSFGNKSENKSKDVPKTDLKNSENRHSWFGQKGDLLSEIESGKIGNKLKPVPKTETKTTVPVSNQTQNNTTVNSSVTIKTVSSAGAHALISQSSLLVIDVEY
ncbi:hypothetical protein LOTGIDRAFT_164585 [Lottia gigantea]|uniref:Uncharacterized protein n=1 Tax=Lottia gigantea TaxID=225164 RepID=V4A9D6_LOTGI|nr:hypothetical protein LOTGIDRAFT_164585 [Lottia gigantea]ESO89891.1 hypothetical protein LOTGIDRAFT_164585 [Lottia gigantea]